MKLSEKQFGFAYIVLILIVALVGIIGILSWWAFNNHSSDSRNNDTTVADPNAGYVVMKEWGIRFKPIQGLQDVTYTIGELSGTQGMIVFSADSLARYGEACSASQKGANPLGRLVRVEDKDAIPSMSAAATVQIGRYYYLYSPPQAICSDDRAAIDLQANLLKLFKDSITSLEATQ